MKELSCGTGRKGWGEGEELEIDFVFMKIRKIKKKSKLLVFEILSLF